MQAQILETLQKSFISFRPQQILPFFPFDTITNETTQLLKHRKISQYSDELFLPTHHTVHALLPYILTFLETSKVQSVRKRGRDDEVLTEMKWLLLQIYRKFKKGQTLLFCTFFFLVLGVPRRLNFMCRCSGKISVPYSVLRNLGNIKFIRHESHIRNIIFKTR